MIAFWEECIQNAFSAFWEECIQNAFSAKTKNQDFPRTPSFPRTPEQILEFEPKPRTKNQDSPRTPEQILEFPNQNQEPRTKIPQDSWANLGFGSWF